MSKGHQAALFAKTPEPSTQGYDDKAAKLAYLRDMLMELARVATATNSSTLAYLLEMAILEADDCLKVHEFKTGLNG